VVLISTHASSYDAFCNMALLDRPVIFIGKKELFDIPLYGRCLTENGNIAVERTNRDQAVGALKKVAL
jgi:1-acyl-sn-glycerol-3-phosphate acyltransferase